MLFNNNDDGCECGYIDWFGYIDNDDNIYING